MNRYFEKENEFNSNSRIFEGFFKEEEYRKSRLEAYCEKLLTLPSRLAAIATNQKACGIVKAGVTACTLIALVGIVGAMEAGSLALGTGILCGALLLAVELLCLKGRRSR